MPSGSDEILRSLDDLAPQQTEPLRISVVREILPDEEIIPGQGLVPKIKELKAAHHQLAKLLASGKPLPDVALITGHSIQHCKNMLLDPSFQELMDHYSVVDELSVMDIQAQMMAVGVDALAILRERQTEEPEKFSIGQLQEQIRLLLLGPAKIESERSAAPKAANVNVTFVNSSIPQVQKTIEGRIED